MFDSSVGFVETRYVEFPSLPLDSGLTLAPLTIAYETYGELNADRSNAILLLHALSGDAHAAGYHPGDGKPGWWDMMVGPGPGVRHGQVLHDLLQRHRRLHGQFRAAGPSTRRPAGVRSALPGGHGARHGPGAEDASRSSRYRAAAGGVRRHHGGDAGPGVGHEVPGDGGLVHPHRHHPSAFAHADRVQRGRAGRPS